VLFKFLEQYVGRLEGPIAMQVWSRYMQLAKEIASSVKDFKIQSFFALRCLSVLADKVTQTSAMEDRRIRKEFQVTHQPVYIVSWCSVSQTLGYVRQIARCLRNSRWSIARPRIMDTPLDEGFPGYKRP
jgi:hypothetical protein